MIMLLAAGRKEGKEIESGGGPGGGRQKSCVTLVNNEKTERKQASIVSSFFFSALRDASCDAERLPGFKQRAHFTRISIR